MPFVYLLQCSDNSYYCGYTNNLEHRVKAHNSGKASKYTRARLPVKIVYAEKLSSLSKALKREYAIKQLSRKEKIGLVKNFKQ
ncbi:MAG: GIY-YIG nuclease family protein [archaeon]